MEATTGPEAAARLATELVAAYTAQLNAYREWLSIAREAQEQLRSNNLEDFLRLHASKEAVAGRLQTMDEQVQACRRGLATLIGAHEPTLSHLQRAGERLAHPAYNAAVDNLPRLLDDLRMVVQELQAVEATTEQLLRERLVNLRSDITRVQAARRAARAYQRPDPTSDGEARFIDRKG